MIFATGFVILMYGVFVFFLWIGWKRAISRKEPLSDGKPFVTVVVPIRNEEKTIGNLVRDLLSQAYGTYEIICVDDHSNDGTMQILEDIADPRLRIVQNQGNGKKKALSTGINQARGEIILTTDADCRLQESWLSSMSAYLRNPRVQLVIGTVSIVDDGVFSCIQQIEFASLVGAGAAAAAMGIPIMCNGANLGFRKEAFTRVGGYDGNFETASGDDEFLMRKIVKLYGRQGVAVCAEKRAVVQTTPQPSLKVFVHQRIRWAGKWRQNRSSAALLVAFFVLIVQLATITSYVQLIFTGASVWWYFIVIRLMLDLWILRSYCCTLRISWKWLPFLLLFIVYPIYVVFIGLVSNFVSYSWKGRIYRP
jgi:poly-beta-1,6-N-acetyl-D-glucosamine synthase